MGLRAEAKDSKVGKLGAWGYGVQGATGLNP